MVCKNCGYNNRDGVGFCRHCGISLKEKSRRGARVKAVKRAPAKYEESNEYNLSLQKTQPKIREEEGIRGGGANFRTATVAIGLFVIACVIAFCIFAFDILILPGSGGDVTVNSVTVSEETAVTEQPAQTPVPTIAPAAAADQKTLLF